MDGAPRDTLPARHEGPPFESLGRRKAYEEVAERIRSRIFAQRLRPSDRLPTERDLARQFGVSRVVVREAVRALEHAGLLAVKKGPKGGIFVTQTYERPIGESISNLLAVGNASLEHLFELRVLIEPYAASRAAKVCSKEDLGALDRLIAECEGCIARGEDIRPKNLEFHRRIMRMTGNPILAAMGETVLRILSERIAHTPSPETSRSVLQMHRKIAAAIRSRQAAKAGAIMNTDIQAIGRRLARMSAGKEAAGSR
jgi:GntR family transcriptional repressor for pyruvate dehydrogenase complex